MGGKENKRNELVVVENHFRDAWLVYSTSQYSTEQQDLFYPHRIYYSVLFICFPNRLLQLHGAFLFRSCGRIPRWTRKRRRRRAYLNVTHSTDEGCWLSLTPKWSHIKWTNKKSLRWRRRLGKKEKSPNFSNCQTTVANKQESRSPD